MASRAALLAAVLVVSLAGVMDATAFSGATSISRSKPLTNSASTSSHTTQTTASKPKQLPKLPKKMSMSQKKQGKGSKKGSQTNKQALKKGAKQALKKGAKQALKKGVKKAIKDAVKNATAMPTQSGMPMNAAAQPQPQDYHQCGGRGGSCSGALCADAQFPANQGGSCVSGLTCFRQNEWYWGCQQTGSQTVTTSSSSATAKMAAQPKPSDYKQCGGRGGSCGSQTTPCKDAQFPASAGTCVTGLTCYRQNEWYWGCQNTGSQPASTSATAKVAPQPTPAATTAPKTAPTPAATTAPTAAPKPAPKSAPTTAPTTANKKMAAPTSQPKPSDYHQCGGTGGCQGAKCKDAPYPADQGGSCVAGLVCRRTNDFYWGCLGA